MGQRHQLFVIARAGQHYRSLAAVHHQWLYGMSALRQCLVLLHIFGHSENRFALQQELRFADEYFRDKGAPSPNPPELSWGDQGGVCPFPFITTCLMMGASLNLETANASVVHEEPFGMGFDQGDNNDGITVIDITDLENVKYCFVTFSGDYEESENQSPLYQPLTGWQYARNYYLEDDPFFQTSSDLPKTLEKKPLIDIATLAETWPWGKWEVDGSAPQDTNHPDNRRVPKGLVEKSMEKIVEALLVSDDLSEFNAAKDQLESLPNCQAILRETLLSRANQVGKTLPSLSLLALAYAGETVLDWANFTSLDVAGLKSAFEAGSFLSVKTLNLSGTAASRSLSELSPILTSLPALKSLYLLDRPDRPSDASTAQAVLNLASSNPDLELDKIITSGVMSIPIRLQLWLPDTNDAPEGIPGCPIVQLLVYHRNEDAVMQVAPYEYFFLGDAILSRGRFVNSLLRYLQLLNPDGYIMGSGTGYQLAACIATSSSNPGDTEAGEVGPLPAQTYKFGKEAYHSSAHGYYSEMRNLKPGQWTVLVSRNASLMGYHEHNGDFDKGFQYAFVRSKSEIAARNPKEGERVEVSADNLEVFSLQGFLQETVPTPAATDLEPLFRQLRLQVARTDQLPQDDDVLRCMNAEQARDLLVKFMDNILTMDKVKEIANKYRDRY